MRIERTELYKTLFPEEGKILVKDEIQSTQVIMPLNGDESEWAEQDLVEEPFDFLPEI